MSEKRKIDWLNHFLEFIVVIIGILLAFQLNTCRESSKEQSIVNEHLLNIDTETEFNRKNLVAAIRTSESLVAQNDSLIDFIQNKKDIRTIHRLSLSLMSLDYVYLKKNAYNSLIETGDIRMIDDFELKNDIVGLYEYYKWLEGIDLATRTTWVDQFFPYTVENMDLIDYKPQALEVYDNKKYKNYLSVYRYSLSYRLQKQKDVLNEIDDFLNRSKNE